MSMIGRSIRQNIRRSRNSFMHQKLSQVCEKYLRAWHNDSFFEFDNNGERFVIEKYASLVDSQKKVVWDVGANNGQWAELIHSHMPFVSVHSFEIIPELAETIRNTNPNSDWLTIYNHGLSDSDGEIEVTYNLTNDTTTAISPRLENNLFKEARLAKVNCLTAKVDTLISDGLPSPDFLKIDVEGHEAAVLRGAEGLLSSEQAPEIIQFEYGDTWIPSNETLFQIQSYLEGFGYSVGRIFPNMVDFKSYHYGDEHYRMGNMIASNNKKIVEALQQH
jgi:FkbM family methyltransferase